MFAGVASTLVASMKNNRDCIAIELDKELYSKGIKRIREEVEN